MTRLIALFLFALLSVSSAHAAQCGGDFNGFRRPWRATRRRQGVSRSVIDSAFAGVTHRPAVLAFDRRQHGMFQQELRGICRQPCPAPRIKRAKGLMLRHAALLSRIERQFGVPATLLMAIWTWKLTTAPATWASCQ